jgi:hypothetical protein
VPQRQVGIFGRERRINVQFEAVLREADGCEIRVQVLDVSSSGFRIHTNAELVTDEEVTLQIARSRPLRAKICWTRGAEAGGVFLDPAETLE